MRTLLILSIAFGILVSAACWALAYGLSGEGFNSLWPENLTVGAILYGPPTRDDWRAHPRYPTMVVVGT